MSGKPEAPEPVPSRARARRKRTPRDVRLKQLAEVEDLMCKLEYDGQRTIERLAGKWGVTESVVEKVAAEASRRITADRDTIRRDITAGGRELMKKALASANARDFVDVGKLLAQVSGANAPEEHIVTSTNLEASPAEAARMVREAFGERALAKPNGVNGHAKSNGSGAVPPDPSES